MFKVFFLIFEPAGTWDRLVQRRRSIGFILATYLIPTLLLLAGVEGWGLISMGKWQPAFQKFREFPPNEVVIFEIIQFFLTIGTVYAVAILFRKVNGTFRQDPSLVPAFTAAAYGLSPLFLFRLLDAIPTVNPWIPWLVGVLVSVWILYQGLPRAMSPDPVHAFGLYLSCIMVVILMTGVGRLFTALYLLGDVDFHHSSILNSFSRLHTK